MPGSIRRKGDTSQPLPPALQPPQGGRRNRVRGRPGMAGPDICGPCKGDPTKKPPVPPRHLHDFQFKSKNGCKCQDPGHGLPRNKRS